METLTPVSTCRHATIRIATSRATELIDLTDRIQGFASDAGLRTGVMNVQTLHTTSAVVVNEHEPLLLTDFEALLARTAPPDARYRHDDPAVRTVNLADGERSNGHAHCRALLLPSSVCVNVAKGQLVLGRWQRVFFVELDGPRERELSIFAFGEAWR